PLFEKSAASTSATTAKIARNTKKSMVIFLIDFHNLFEKVLRQHDSSDSQFLEEARADAARPKRSDDVAVRPHAAAGEGKDVLHGDDVALHPRNLGDIDHAPGAVAHARDLDDNTDGR